MKDLSRRKGDEGPGKESEGRFHALVRATCRHLTQGGQRDRYTYTDNMYIYCKLGKGEGKVLVWTIKSESVGVQQSKNTHDTIN